jgi:molybdopterin-guanine dinucleotide biosynthesis protein A
MPSTRILADAIIVAGGKASRLGGIDKCMLPLGPERVTLLETAMDHFAGQVVVAGAQREIGREVLWVADENADGGPAAGVWAGLGEINAPFVFLLAGDQLVDHSVLARLVAQANADGAWAIDSDSISNPLCSYVRVSVLRDLLADTHGQNQSLSKLLRTLELAQVSVSGDEVRDFDTWTEIIGFARTRLGSEVMTNLWLERVAADLGIPDVAIPEELLLNLTRDVAHNIERKLAPLTTFLIGYAAGRLNEDPIEVAARVQIAIEQWTGTTDD